MERRFKLADIGHLAKNTVKAIFEGELLLRLNIGRFFIHILYCFAVITLTIWISLLIDNTLTKVERNKKTIQEQEAIMAMQRYEMASITRRSEVEYRLEQMGSPLREAGKPATRIE